MIVRPAGQDDAAALTACLVAAYAPFEQLGLPDVSGSIADDIAANHVWVAEVNEKVQGGIVLVLGGTAHIANLAAHAHAGGHGIGQALIEQAKRAATAAGFAEIHLATHAMMTATQDFYRKRGWIETGREGRKVHFTMKLN